MISQEIYDVVMANAQVLDSVIVYGRDFNYNLYVHHAAVFTRSYLSLVSVSKR